MSKDPNREAGPILLFDGVCNLCSASVDFVIDRDANERFRFASLQSDAGRRLLEQFGLPTDSLDTLVLVIGDRCYTKSSAALRVARLLSGLWPVLFVLILVPRPIRDFLYDRVAVRRYRWFGKKDSCRIPTPQLRKRFLD